MAKMSVMETFAKNVQTVLRKRGWTIQELAHRCDQDRSNLSKIVRGVEGCTLEKAVTIARALEVPLSALVEDFSEICAA